MPLANCPDCGAQLSPNATVCPQCGFPLRQAEAARPTIGIRGRARAESGTGTAIFLGIVGFAALLVLGIAAAIAIPRFSAAAKQAKQAEGEGLLRRVYALENEYFTRHGSYAPSLDSLKDVGWTEPPKLRYYTVEIASWEAANLCLHALPRPGAKVRPLRMRAAGYVEPGARCDTYGGDSTTVATDARRVMRRVHAGLSAWYEAHERRLPANDAELAEAYPSETDPDFVVTLMTTQYGGFCVNLAPRTQPPSPVLLSMDSGGNLYDGDGCAGKTASW
jgi:type IV pilus assembly protein PilE